MFDAIKSMFGRGKELTDSDYTEIYSELQKIVSNPVEYAQDTAKFSGPQELKADFKEVGVKLPPGWNFQQAYSITQNRIPEGRDPREVKDIAVMVSLVGMGFSMGGHIGLDIARGIILEYFDNYDYSWPQASKSVLKKIRQGKGIPG